MSIEYNHKGIKIDAEVEMKLIDYRDKGGNYRTRFDRNLKVGVKFWEFSINNNLTELAFVKSTLSYFMQLFWKRTSKEDSKIDLVKIIHRDYPNKGRLSLYFVARQKNKKHFLQICLQRGDETVNESYLDGQEVVMLDIAIGKAIGLLTPTTIIIGHEKQY